MVSWLDIPINDIKNMLRYYNQIIYNDNIIYQKRWVFLINNNPKYIPWSIANYIDQYNFSNIRKLEHLGYGTSGNVNKYQLPSNKFIAIKKYGKDHEISVWKEIYTLYTMKYYPNIVNILHVDMKIIEHNIKHKIMLDYYQTDLSKIYFQYSQ